jgi:hypothetical protein
MQLERLESRTFMSAGAHAVTVPLHAAAEGSLPGNIITGHATHLGKFTASFNADGVLVFTTARGDEFWIKPGPLVPTGPGVLHVEGVDVGGTGRFAGSTGMFSIDLIQVDDQGGFVYRFSDESVTLQRPWNDKALS